MNEDPGASAAWSAPAQPGLDEAWRALGDCPEIRLYLDYDGTLVPHTDRPADAQPDDEILAILDSLGHLPGVQVAIVSGRPGSELENWLGRLPVALWGEHGATSRERGGRWAHGATAASWDPSVRGLLERFRQAVPGSSIEVKAHGLAWHYRAASVAPGTTRLRAFVDALADVVAPHALEVMPGDGVIEVRHMGIHKGLAVEASEVPGLPATVAIGNDRTDEDMFKALPPLAMSIVVGTVPSSAAFRVAGVADVRRLLRQLITQRECAASVRAPEFEAAARPGSDSRALEEQ